MTEKFDTQEYRDNLANELNEARGLGEKGKDLARDLLNTVRGNDTQPGLEEYIIAKKEHVDENIQTNIKKSVNLLKSDIEMLKTEKAKKEMMENGFSIDLIGEGEDYNYYLLLKNDDKIAYVFPAESENKSNRFNDGLSISFANGGYGIEEEICNKIRESVVKVRSNGVEKVLWVGYYDKDRSEALPGIDGELRPGSNDLIQKEIADFFEKYKNITK